MKRAITSALEAWKISQPRKPLLLRGARQVGKTYILKEFCNAHFNRVHYLNFEESESLGRFFERDLNPIRLLEEFTYYLRKKIDPGQDVLIFDEVQRCPRALTSLKYFREEMPEFAVCAAGSLIGLSLGTESFPVGQVTFLDLRPMSFLEFLYGIEEVHLADLLSKSIAEEQLPEAAHERLWNLWISYLVTGGLPEVVQTYRNRRAEGYDAMREVRKLQRDLVTAYLADIAKHSGKVNAMHIERLLHSVPAQLARAQNGSALKFRFRDAVPGVRGYERLAGPMDWLERADLVIRAFILNTVRMPLGAYSKENMFKLYLFDVGMLGALSGLQPDSIMRYGFGGYQGYVAENFVAQELRAAGSDALYSWRGRTSELEFLVETEGGIIPLEVKSGRVTHSRSLNVYEERYRPVCSYVFSARNIGRRGIRRYIPVYAAGALIERVLGRR